MARRSAALLLVGLLTLAACADTAPADSAPAVPDDRAARAAAAGLTDDDVAYLDSTGVTVYVPVMPAGWSRKEVFVEADESGRILPYYAITYTSETGACVSVGAATEGLGDVFVEEPPHERAVAVPGVPTDGPARLGWATAATKGWEAGHVGTEWFGAGMPQFSVATSADEGCRNASPDEVEAVLKTLRPLNPADDR